MATSIDRLLLENVQPRPGRGSWHGGPTPVGALRRVGAEQAVWRPAAGRKNIWDLALHIAYWKYAVRRRLEGAGGGSRSERFPRSPANWPRLPADPGDSAWAADLRLLAGEHQRLVAAIARVPQSALGRKPAAGGKWTCGELITGIAQHDAYHTGQIQLLKRLWESRGRR